jgi:hypothetical protein
LDGISLTQAAADEAQVGIKSIYNVTDVPCTATLLGMTIEYDANAGVIYISSHPYLEHILTHCDMSDCNSKSMPLPIVISSLDPVPPPDQLHLPQISSLPELALDFGTSALPSDLSGLYTMMDY